MKKQKALEEMTHQDLFEALIYDENIQDNMNVTNDYPKDKYGNSRISLSFENIGTKRRRGEACIMLFVFNKQGRLVGVEAAIRKSGERAWHIAVSDVFLDFSTRFSDDLVRSKKKKK